MEKPTTVQLVEGVSQVWFFHVVPSTASESLSKMFIFGELQEDIETFVSKQIRGI